MPIFAGRPRIGVYDQRIRPRRGLHPTAVRRDTLTDFHRRWRRAGLVATDDGCSIATAIGGWCPNWWSLSGIRADPRSPGTYLNVPGLSYGVGRDGRLLLLRGIEGLVDASTIYVVSNFAGAVRQSQR